ncbi:MAG TPA: hypothetical protein GXX14_00100 [Clostridiaceae bacterium]|nr:hypothetical protein [Clostridiaceae bacterium]
MRIIDKERMSPKERVLTAFARQEPDRVPINYFANQGIHARLLQYFNLKPDDNDALLDILGVDFRVVAAKYKGPRLHAKKPGRNVDPEWGIVTRWIEHSSGGYWDYCDFPLKDADEEEIARWPMPSPDDYDYDEVMEQCHRYEKFAIGIGNPGLIDIINSTGMLRGMEQTLIDLATGNPAGLLLIDRKLDIQLEVTRRTIEIAKGKIDFVWIGEDLGTQNSQMISLDLFRKHIRPRHQKFIDIAKKYNLPVMIHSCGSSSWAFDDFVEMGIDVVDTLQPEAKDMQPKYLKERYGDRLAFHGCISTAGPLAYGSVQEVINNIKDILDIMMPGGGYCAAPTHLIQDNTPVENVIAMYETIHKYGVYR